MKHLYLLIAFAIGSVCFAQPTELFYRSAPVDGVNGIWNNKLNWETSTNGTAWDPAEYFPGETEDIISVSVLIQCEHTIHFSTNYNYYKKIEELIIEGRLEIDEKHLQIQINQITEDFRLIIDGGMLYFRNKSLLQLPARTVLSISGPNKCDRDVSGPTYEYGLDQDNCNNSNNPILKIGNTGYNCKTGFKAIMEGSDDNLLGSLPTASPPVVCYYDNTTKPTVNATYINYLGGDWVNYKLELDTQNAPAVPVGSNFDINLVQNASGTLNNPATQKTINLDQPLDKVGDYKFLLTIERCETNANPCPSQNVEAVSKRGVVITKGDENVFDGDWDSNKPIPNLLNGYTAVITENYDTNIQESGSFGACSCVVRNGATLTIGSEDFVTLLDNIHVEEGSNVIIKNNGNLLQQYDTAVNIGDITVEKTISFSEGRDQFNFVSVPVVDASADIKSTIYGPENQPPLVQEYNPSTFYFDNTPGPYVSGKGYAVQDAPLGTPEGKFKGEPFNGILPYSISDYPAGSFYLVGNPYPSNINIDILYKLNEDKIWPHFLFWDNRGNDVVYQEGPKYDGSSYAIYNALSETGVPVPEGTGTAGAQEDRIPTANVRSGTGFMIQTRTTGTLDFNNSMRNADNSGPEFFGRGGNSETSDKDRYWITLTTPGEMIVTTAVVYFEGGNEGLGPEDTGTMYPSDDLFTLVDEERLAIQGKGLFDSGDEVELGYEAYAPGFHTIALYNPEGIFAEDRDVYLIDKLLDKRTNLSNGSYMFQSGAGVFNDRFLIVYAPRRSFQTFTYDRDGIEITKADREIRVTSLLSNLSQVEAFDMGGRQLYGQNQLMSKEHSFSVPVMKRQIVIIKVTTEDGKTESRKFYVE